MIKTYFIKLYEDKEGRRLAVKGNFLFPGAEKRYYNRLKKLGIDDSWKLIETRFDNILNDFYYSPAGIPIVE